ncbi:MAG: ECF transporter S component [Tenericutes bacterium]|nr:ECF transporter S component [Mycoplasmatota bacterium]
MRHTKKIALAAMFLALTQGLPFLTAQIPTFGQMLTPMHFPVILASIFLGPLWGLAIGFIAPLMRLLLFGMPQMPMAIMMAFELAVYGLITGLFIKLLKNIKIKYLIKVLITLVIAMLLGRIMFALAALVFLQNANFVEVFIGTFTASFIGIILQLILIPLLALRLKDYVQNN